MSTEIKAYTEIEEINGVTYEGWTVWWWSWALQGPRSVNPVYDMTGNNALRGQPSEEPYHVIFLAGSFDRESKKGKFIRRITTNDKTSILIPIVNSNISREEHDDVFKPSNANAQVLSAADDVINRAQGSLRIEVGGSSVDYTINGSEKITPVRIRPKFGMSPMYPGEGIVKSHSGSDLQFMYSAVDGYWIFLKPLSPGEYTFRIRGDAPWFGGNKEEERFVTDVTYEVTVTSVH